MLAYDGDVMKFAGDSMIMAFSPTEEEMKDDDGGKGAATLRCVSCASDLANAVGELLGLCPFAAFDRLTIASFSTIYGLAHTTYLPHNCLFYRCL